MSHTVTVTRTTTTTTSAIILNTGYMKTWPGILKFIQLLIGIINVGLVSYYKTGYYQQVPTLYFLLMSTTFMIGTFLLLISCLLSISTASILPKTIHEFIYHLFAFLMILISSLVFLTEVTQHHTSSTYYDALLSASVLGLILACLYMASTVFSHRSYRGL